MKRTLLIVFAAFFAIAAGATSYDVVSVDLNDGSKVDIALTGNLSLSFNSTHLLVKGTDADFEIPKEKILSFSHSGESAIKEIAPDSSVDLDGRTLHFKGLTDGSLISVYDLCGKSLLSAKAANEYTLGLDDIPSGVYIVTVNNVSYKISLK